MNAKKLKPMKKQAEKLNIGYAFAGLILLFHKCKKILNLTIMHEFYFSVFEISFCLVAAKGFQLKPSMVL